MTHRDFRWRPDGFEGHCRTCGEWWPLTLEFWQPRHGVNRCRACWKIYHRLSEAGRRTDELVREAHREADRARYHANRPAYAAAAAKWRAEHRDHIAAYNRAYRERNKERDAEKRRAYYADARSAILLKKRVRYQETKEAA